MGITKSSQEYDSIQDQIRQIVDFLQTARNGKRLRQRDIEEMCGLPQATISKIEKGDTSPTLTTLLKYANALGLTVCFKSLEKCPAALLTVENFRSTSLPDGADVKLLTAKANRLIQRYEAYLEHVEYGTSNVPSVEMYASALLEHAKDYDFYACFPDPAMPLHLVLKTLGLDERKDYISQVYPLSGIPVNSLRIVSYLNWAAKKLMTERGLDQESAVEQIRDLYRNNSLDLAWCEAPERPE